MPSISAAPTQHHYLWDEIVRGTIEACILRKEGREREVSVLLHERLPELIRSWSSRCGLSAEVCKQSLRDLFRRVQEGVEMGFIHRRLIVEEICSRLREASPGRGSAADFSSARATPRLRTETGPVRLRQRVAIADVSGMLDALAEAEVETRNEAILPMRVAAPALIPLLTEEESSPAVLTA